MSEAKKYFWLKLKRDFFKRHDIRIIEAMPNGKDYILFYLKLLCESVDHDGNLRFSEQIPYNEEMLSTITNTNIDVVRSAIRIFTELNMMEIMDDGTFFMNEVEKLVGCETEWAKKKREYRAKQKEILKLETNEGQKKTLSDKSKSKSKSIEIDKDIKEKDISKDISKKKTKNIIPPKLEDVINYCNERNNGIDAQYFIDFYESKDWMIGKNKMKDWKAAVRTWERNNKNKTNTQCNWNGYNEANTKILDNIF